MNKLALNTKTRSLLSKHLTLEDYQKLESIKTVGNLLNAIEENERYKEVTYNLHNHEFHRDELEEDIRLIIPREYRKLKRYMDKKAIDPYLINLERELITNKLYSLKHDLEFNVYRNYVEVSDSFAYSLQTLKSIRNINDLKTHLSKSIYAKYLSTYDETQPFWKSELELFVYEYTYLLDNIPRKEKQLRFLISKTFLFKTFQIIEGLRKLEIDNIQYFLNLLPEKIGDLNKNEIRNWLAGQHYKTSVLEYLRAPKELDSIEEGIMYCEYRQYLHTLRYSEESGAILYAYIGLDEIESNLLIRIIESTRYEHESDYLYQYIFKERSG